MKSTGGGGCNGIPKRGVGAVASGGECSAHVKPDNLGRGATAVDAGAVGDGHAGLPRDVAGL
jgi:hypothetical protein